VIEIVKFVFSDFWIYLGTAALFLLGSFGWALTFYWLTRFRETKQDAILRELEMARLERYEFERLLKTLNAQDPYLQ